MPFYSDRREMKLHEVVLEGQQEGQHEGQQEGGV